MKLRLKGNSIRIRLDRRDLERLVEQGRVEDALRFGPGRAFVYAVEVGPASAERPSASYADGRLTLTMAASDVRTWIEGDRVGFEHEQDVDGGVVRILIEKDFACIDRPAGSGEDDAFAFPNPSQVC